MKISRIYADTKDRKVSKTLQTLKKRLQLCSLRLWSMFSESLWPFVQANVSLFAVLAAPCILLREGSQKV